MRVNGSVGVRLGVSVTIMSVGVSECKCECEYLCECECECEDNYPGNEGQRQARPKDNTRESHASEKRLFAHGCQCLGEREGEGLGFRV